MTEKHAAALQERRRLLDADHEHIRAALRAEADESYVFTDDVRAHMQAQNLSENELARRCGLSRTAVSKWLSGRTLPNGKEHMKELGMALGMDENELSAFLLKNRYTRLYSKNPFDAVCKRVLQQHAGDAEIVFLYHAELGKHKERLLSPSRNRAPFETRILSQSLKEVASETDFAVWLDEHSVHFEADEKTMLPSLELQQYVKLFVNHSPLAELYLTDELPDPVRRLLYRILGGQEYALRGLREKLIVFGLWANITDGDLSTMLGYARLAPLPSSKVETALVAIMRRAHERCPHYEYGADKRALASIVKNMKERRFSGETSMPELENQKNEFRERCRLLQPRIELYNASLDAEDEQFEEWYFDHLSNYAKDLLMLLAARGDLRDDEIAPYVELIENVAPEQ